MKSAECKGIAHSEQVNLVKEISLLQFKVPTIQPVMNSDVIMADAFLNLGFVTKLMTAVTVRMNAIVVR